jgi:hypothetical protein
MEASAIAVAKNIGIKESRARRRKTREGLGEGNDYLASIQVALYASENSETDSSRVRRAYQYGVTIVGSYGCWSAEDGLTGALRRRKTLLTWWIPSTESSCQMSDTAIFALPTKTTSKTPTENQASIRSQIPASVIRLSDRVEKGKERQE